jgi:hypothetical protein
MQKSLHFFLLAGFVGITFWSCQKEILPDNTDKGFPLTIRVTGTPENPTIEWDRANTGRFERYILVQSTDSIVAGQSPFSFPTLLNTNNQDSLRTTNISSFSESTLFYKLYVDIGNRQSSGLPAEASRFLESPTVKIKFNNFIVQGSPTIVRYFPEKNWMFVANSINGNSTCDFELIDLNTYEMIGTKSGIPIAQIESVGVDMVKKGDNEYELYWWGPGLQYRIYSLPDFQLKSTVSSSVSAFTLVANPVSGHLYTTQFNSSEGTAVRRASDFTKLDVEYRSNYYDYRSLAILDPNEALVIEAGPFTLKKFNVNNTSGIVSNNVSAQTNSSVILLNGPVLSPDKQHFIVDRSGSVYNRSLTVTGTPPVPVSGQGFSDFCFSPDGQFVYGVSESLFSFNTTNLAKFKFPEMTLVLETQLNNVSPSRIFPADNGVLFVGNNVNNNFKYIIKKIVL